ncbi:MAG: hypothetical protein FJ265_14710, partial [Planctomycetes bacterium]|nr:hypothetical protein [Planctomycetota bacterium]
MLRTPSGPLCAAIVSAACAFAAPAQEPWRPVPGRIATRWAAEVTPENVWPEYPRPTLARAAWQNLNGLWDYTITAGDAGLPPQG